MISWFKYPFIRLLIPFSSGILLAFFIRNIILSEKKLVFLLMILLLLLLLMIVTSAWVKKYRYRFFFSLILNVFLIIIGFFFVKIEDYKLRINDLSNVDCVPAYYVARLVECPVEKENSIKVMMEILEIRDDSNIIYDNDSKLIAYFEKSEMSYSLRYGDCIAFITNPEVVEKPPNPEQFDYKEYLYKKGVSHQVYLKSDAWIDLDYNRANPVYQFSYWIRDFLLATMQRLGVQDDEYAVAAAILLGYDESLPMELRQKYVAAGAMHILCVSGLHVGVIFMVFSYMLVFLDDRKKYQRLIKHLVLLVLIWFYALLAGLAPSILRATIMLSFVLLGNIMNKKGILLNSLAASAFILLCIKPSNLFDVGFQLSYVAVIGIVILQKPISKMFYFKYKIFNKIWEITSVTIAAQIATAPFTIYYFHQFPMYFWLSNLFMTPVSSVVIIGGMIMLLIFFLPYLNELVAWIVSKMIYLMNYGVSWIESLPNSIIKGLYINDSQFVILIILLLSLMFFVELKRRRILIYMMFFVSLFLAVDIYHNLEKKKQEEMIVYSINNMTAIDFISGDEHLLLSDSTFFSDESVFSYNIENFLIKKGLYNTGEKAFLKDDFDANFVKKRKNVVIFDEKLIGMTDGSDFSYDELSYKIPLDYMVLYGRRRQDLKKLLNVYTVDYLIIDGSVPSYLHADLLQDADSLGIKCHSVREKGAFLIK